MDEEYDIVVLGSGLAESVLSASLSLLGKKVLNIDKNDYYGGEMASLSLNQLFQKFGKEVPTSYGQSKDWNLDMNLKYVLADGTLSKMFEFTRLNQYVSFSSIKGSFLLGPRSIFKVPVTGRDILKSGINLPLMDMKRLHNLVSSCKNCNFDKGEVPPGFRPETPMRVVFENHKLSPKSCYMVGHVIALNQTDDYLDLPCIETFKKIQCYADSVSRFGNSPYIYPLYGSSEISQAFVRLCAVYGGVHMLRTPVEEVLTDEETGKFVGVKINNGTIVNAKMVIGDPSYFPDRVINTGRVVRCLCVLNHPIKGVDSSDSCQIIIPGHHVNRKSDIYIGLVSHENMVCPRGFYVAGITANHEHPGKPELDVQPAIDLISPVLESFTIVSDVFKPKDDGTQNNIFISKSQDGTTHLETATEDIGDMWTRITGEKLDIKKLQSQVKIQTEENT